MKLNSDLGYEPVTYSELTQDEAFWQGCKSCVNYDILMSKERKNCLCTAMLYDPEDQPKVNASAIQFKLPAKGYEREPKKSKKLRFVTYRKKVKTR